MRVCANVELPERILEVYRPLLCEMEEMTQELNFAEFVEASGRLYESLHLSEKNELLNYKKRERREANAEFLFQVEDGINVAGHKPKVEGNGAAFCFCQHRYCKSTLNEAEDHKDQAGRRTKKKRRARTHRVHVSSKDK